MNIGLLFLWLFGVMGVLVFLWLLNLLEENYRELCENCLRARKSTNTGSYQGYFCMLREREVKPWNTCNQFMEIEQ